MKFVPGEIYKSRVTSAFYICVYTIDETVLFFCMGVRGVHFWHPTQWQAEKIFKEI